jgi:hypothetical protein
MKRLLAVIWLSLCAQTAGAQDTLAVRDTAEQRFPPSKALLRSLLLPGWGQFSVGAVKRGVFFAAAQGSSYYMLIRTNSRLSKAEDKLEGRRQEARDSILALPPDTAAPDLELRVDSVATVIAANGLVRSRERHMQDWITYTLFFTLASGVDAFVAAHLADFPADVTAERRPNGTTQLRISVPFPSRRQR